MKKKILAVAAGSILATFAFAAPASAHVTVSPKTAEKGGYTKLTFRVPNEKDNASTTKVEVNLPTDKPIASVSVQPHAGWTYVAEKTKLATPIKDHDGDITDSVSKITWTAQGDNSIKPSEFDEFNVSVGPLPSDTGTLTFKALQTYSDGEVVRWIDTATDAAKPAPVLTLTDKAGATTAAPGATSESTINASEVKKSDVDGAKTIGIIGVVLGALGLVAAIGAYFRRPKA